MTVDLKVVRGFGVSGLGRLHLMNRVWFGRGDFTVRRGLRNGNMRWKMGVEGLVS